MKIYIENYSIEKLPKKMKGLNKYLINKTNTVEVYSDQGIFIIDQQNIYNVTYLDKEIKKNKYISETGAVFDMIIDTTETTKTLVNHLPSDNIIMKTDTQIYQINASSKIKMVVTFILNKVQNEYKLYDFYFDVSNDIDINSPIFKEDINVFLFHLN